MDDKAFAVRFESDYRSMYDGASPTEFTALDFVGALGSISGALLYSKLFSPDFVECDGMIFIKDLLEDLGKDGVVKLYQQYTDRRDVEKQVNHFNLTLNLPNRLNENEPGDDRRLADQLAKMWSLQLHQKYSGRLFDVRVFEKDGEAIVSFHQLADLHTQTI